MRISDWSSDVCSSDLLYAIDDRVVDDYEPVIEELDNAIRETETDVFSPSGSNPAGRIYQLKRAVLELHTVVAPLVPALQKLAEIGSASCRTSECQYV